MCAGWDSSESITKRLLEQFKSKNDQLNEIEFVYDNSYDIIIYNNYVTENPKPNTRAYIFFHEPTWSGSHQKNFDGVSNLTIFGFDKSFYTPQDKVIESIACTFYGGRGSWIDKSEDWNYDTIISSTNIKTKNISSVITTFDHDTNADANCSYKTRSDIIKHLLNNNVDYVDFYGGWVGASNCVNKPEKICAIKDYRFCLAVENQFINNWISEKFYDSILYDTIPIYYGCQNIREIYPENGYILIDNIHNFESIRYLLNYINDNATHLYESMLPELQKIKHKYLTHNNLLSKIKSLI